MTKQEKVIRQLAHKHGISEAQAIEIFELQCAAMRGIISDPATKTENGFWNPDEFKSFGLVKFGKFTPKKKQIVFMNNLLQEKLNASKP